MANSCVIVNFNSHINKQMPFQVIKSMSLLSTGRMRSLCLSYYKSQKGENIPQEKSHLTNEIP